MGKIVKTIQIEDTDHTIFMAAKLDHMKRINQQISNTEFFSEVIRFWQEGKHEDQP